jgi:hypothetical protein
MNFAIIEGNWGTPQGEKYQVKRNDTDYLCAVCEVIDTDKKSLVSPLFNKYEDAISFINELNKGQ